MKAGQDFNYRVALADGLKKLQAGRLREAETQFRFLMEKFPAHDGGYRGLAKVLVELEDRGAALVVLRDGASAMAKRGNRAGAITMLRDATGLDPMDLSSHRRLVAALSLNGDAGGAVKEVERFVAVQPDVERARLEIAYDLERLPGEPGILALARRLNVEVSEGASQIDERSVALAADTMSDEDQAAAVMAALGLPREVTPAPPGPPPSERTTQRGPLDEARAHLDGGRLNAASDLLLELIAKGDSAHEAQRMLLDVARGLGRRDLADAKAKLLVEVERL